MLVRARLSRGDSGSLGGRPRLRLLRQGAGIGLLCPQKTGPLKLEFSANLSFRGEEQKQGYSAFDHVARVKPLEWAPEYQSKIMFYGAIHWQR